MWTMATLEKSWMVITLFLLFFSYILADSVSYNSSVNLFRSWYNSNSLGSWDFDDGSTIRPILFISDSPTNPPFGFGFFANGTTTNKFFYLVVFLASLYSFNPDFNTFYPPVVVWCANRDNPVRENATLGFTVKGGLKLKDADGTLVWFTNTSGHSVRRLNITDGGNLMLLDANDSVIWQSFDYYSSVNLSRSWYNSNSSDLGSWDFPDGSTIRPILFISNSVTNPPFGFGFFANGTATSNLFYLVVFLDSYDRSGYYSPVVVWCANRDKPVRENATLDFTAKGGLELKDADGTLVWSTNTSGQSVSRLNITDGGNLVLLDAKDSVIWQSFDYPTDAWLPNQIIYLGKGLTARNSSSNLGTGLYSFSVTRHSVDAFISYDPPARYMSLTYDDFTRLLEYSSIEAHTNYAQFNLKNITNAGFQYLMLEPTGHLNLYQLSEITNGFYPPYSQNIFAWLSECDYPTACGNYGVCSGNGQCSCPGGNFSYFTQLQELEPTLGCREVTPLSCKNKHLHSFLELKDVTSFTLEPIYSYKDVESCKRACLDNCTCKAALFSSGQCYLASQLYSLNDNAVYDFLAFIKVQRLQHKKKSSLVPIFVPTLSASIAIILVIAAYYYKMQINSKYKEEEEDDQVIGPLKRFSFLELKSATHEFQVRLGRGGFGPVFEGDLDDGTKVAVKLLDSTGQGRKEFLAEVNTIGNTNHFNLARLIGYCAEKSNRLLVYEHMCNGSLDKWIFNPDRAQALTWEIRRKIIIGLAKGLEYLHMHCNPSIIHFDIKPQNILLDRDFNVKISDFGLAKLIDRDQSQVLTVLKGTPGYVAPELFKGTNISVKADVFSFGIVILEVVFGRKNLGSPQSDPLVEIVKEKAQTDQLHNLVDGYNEDMECHKEEAMKMIKIALWCLQAHNRRPSMSTVLKVLEGLMDLESIAEYCFISTPNIEPHLEANSALSTPPVASIVSGPR